MHHGRRISRRPDSATRRSLLREEAWSPNRERMTRSRSRLEASGEESYPKSGSGECLELYTDDSTVEPCAETLEFIEPQFFTVEATPHRVIVRNVQGRQLRGIASSRSPAAAASPSGSGILFQTCGRAAMSNGGQATNASRRIPANIILAGLILVSVNADAQHADLTRFEAASVKVNNDPQVPLRLMIGPAN